MFWGLHRSSRSRSCDTAGMGSWPKGEMWRCRGFCSSSCALFHLLLLPLFILCPLRPLPVLPLSAISATAGRRQEVARIGSSHLPHHHLTDRNLHGDPLRFFSCCCFSSCFASLFSPSSSLQRDGFGGEINPSRSLRHKSNNRVVIGCRSEVTWFHFGDKPLPSVGNKDKA